jgi:hypothetical protein
VDNLTVQLQKASYRGVSFGVRSEAQDNSGRKIILHEYVNSPQRFIEDLGQHSPTFTIEAFVYGLDFLSRARKLESALDIEGEALLTMPSLGTFKVQALPYTKTVSQKAIGEISYRLVFATGRPSSGPQVSNIDKQQVFVLGDTARQAISDNTSFVPPKSASNIEIFSADINTAARGISNSVDNFIASTEIEDLDLLVRTITRTSATLTQRVADIGHLFVVDGATKGIWQNVSLGSTAINQIKASFTRMIELTRFGAGDTFKDQSRAVANADGIPVWPNTTEQRRERNANRLSLINQQRINALVVAYEISAAREFSTQIEIDEATAALEVAHESLMLDATNDESLVQSNSDVRVAVEAVRFAALSVIASKKQRTTTTTSIIIRSPTSVLVEAYKQYSDGFLNAEQLTSQAMDLRNLNPDQPAFALFGPTTIFRT